VAELFPGLRTNPIYSIEKKKCIQNNLPWNVLFWKGTVINLDNQHQYLILCFALSCGRTAAIAVRRKWTCKLSLSMDGSKPKSWANWSEFSKNLGRAACQSFHELRKFKHKNSWNHHSNEQDLFNNLTRGLYTWRNPETLGCRVQTLADKHWWLSPELAQNSHPEKHLHGWHSWQPSPQVRCLRWLPKSGEKVPFETPFLVSERPIRKVLVLVAGN